MNRFSLVLLVALTTMGPATATAASPSSAPSAREGCHDQASAPFGTGECPGVRPGGLIRGTVCTLNFLFRGSDGERYIGTAGHCALAASGEIAWKRGKGPEAVGGDGERIGEFAYAVDEGQRDFALIRIDSDVDADAEMCFFGGPSGIYRAHSSDPFLVHHFGHGAGVGSVPGGGPSTLPARSALARDSLDRWTIFIHGVASPGDSGSPVISENGEAVGVLIGIGTGDLHVSRLVPHLERAEGHLGISLRLVKGSWE